MYTEAFGRASYLVARSRGKKSSVSKALFMPLSVVEMEVCLLYTSGGSWRSPSLSAVKRRLSVPAECRQP